MSYKIIQNLLTPNKWSRPQKPLTKKALVIHWVANPLSTAKANRDFFESLKLGTPNPDTGTPDYGSAHEVIDLNGDIVVCIPNNELAYNCGSSTYTQDCLNRLGSYPNGCTYGIECTHIDWTGKMTDLTYNTLIERCADLCDSWGLNPLTDIWTHQMVVGWKDCHRWFVNNPSEWSLFLTRVKRNVDLRHVAVPQWQYDCATRLLKQGYFLSAHMPNEVVTVRLFAAMINNVTDKLTSIPDPFLLLKNKGYFLGYHDAGEELTIQTFGMMMINKTKETVIKDPLTFLVTKGYLDNSHKATELLYVWTLGAIVNNFKLA